MSSSPIRPGDMMDISPMPQKGGFTTTFEVTSPTPQEEPDDEMMLESSPLAHTRQHASASDLSRTLHEYVDLDR